jgi:hypothetical protein
MEKYGIWGMRPNRGVWYVEAELGRALAVARRQEARSFELRAAVSLLRHRMEWGDGTGAREARDLLARGPR